VKDLFDENIEFQKSYDSIGHYKDLVKLASSIRDDYLKNVNKFHNQLSFEDINEKCYLEMYSKIAPGSPNPKISELQKKISGLSELNKDAYSFFLKKRNNSVKGMDVQLGNKFDEVFIEFLKSKSIKAERADQKNKKLPDIQVLDRTRNIKAYIEHKYHNAPFMLSYKMIGRESYEGSITLDTKKLQNQIIECESELPNRPVYIVHWVDFHHLKGVFFNTLGQIKEYLASGSEFERQARAGDYKMTKKVGYTEKFYPPLHEMGDLRELLEKLSK
tara:strand:+ start:565 stop:1386 length:822 start_codon:yes stop_codon:yes gene_type:complete